jgi:hypothetical protein
MDPLTSPVAEVRLNFGEAYALTRDGPAQPVLGQGWYAPDTWGTWSRSGAVGMRLPDDVFDRAKAQGAAAVRLRLDAHALLGAHLPARRVRVSVAGRYVALWRFSRARNARWVTADIPVAVANRDDGPVRVTLDVSGELRPTDLGANADTRSLGLAVEALMVAPVDKPAPAGRK